MHASSSVNVLDATIPAALLLNYYPSLSCAVELLDGSVSIESGPGLLHLRACLQPALVQIPITGSSAQTGSKALGGCVNAQMPAAGAVAAIAGRRKDHGGGYQVYLSYQSRWVCLEHVFLAYQQKG